MKTSNIKTVMTDQQRRFWTPCVHRSHELQFCSKIHSSRPRVRSDDGGVATLEGLITFYFWDTREKQSELFEAFYPCDVPGFSPRAKILLAQYRRLPSAILPSGVPCRPDLLHLIAVSYADGCCTQALA